jgi:hypothetical protein
MGVNNSTRTLTEIQIQQITQLLDQILQSEVPIGVIDGSNNVYTTSVDFVATTTILTRNGVQQTLNLDYTESGPNEITLVSVPQVGEILFIQYKALTT